jgi:polar amino acid transport system substrate-binding protein
MPLFDLADSKGHREGYEPGVGSLLADTLDRPLRWEFRQWSDMLPSLADPQIDGVLCGQGISPSRLEVADFTHPYAVFDESVLVRAGDTTTSATDLAGKKVAAIDGSVNLTLAQTFEGAHLVPFDGGSDDVFADMLNALAAAEVDAVVDDDVALLPLDGDDRFSVAFTVPTRNPWGIAVSKDRPDVKLDLNYALTKVIRSGELKQVWEHWLPGLEFPLREEA